MVYCKNTSLQLADLSTKDLNDINDLSLLKCGSAVMNYNKFNYENSLVPYYLRFRKILKIAWKCKISRQSEDLADS